MIALAFLEANMDPSIQVGSNLRQLNGNYRVGNSDYFIIEACEYSDSFLNFKERSAIVLNIDDDHLDYFGTIDNTQKSFEKYVSMLPSDGYLVINNDDFRCVEVSKHTKAKVITVGSNNKAEWYYDNVIFDSDGYPSYDVYHNNEYVDNIKLQVVGLHNVMNSLCAFALCNAYGIDIDTFKKAMLKFTGADRRMEYKGKFKNAKVFDDYGHHPTEVEAVVRGLKNKEFNEDWVIFEPHTYSRLVQHLEEFGRVLSEFDHIIIIDIYAAREKNTFNISEEDLIKEIKKHGKDAVHISDYEEIKKYLNDNVSDNDIILTLGAGYVTKISELLTK
jgi:UDP-N-acetylmuramate--alanine ligase